MGPKHSLEDVAVIDKRFPARSINIKVSSNAQTTKIHISHVVSGLVGLELLERFGNPRNDFNESWVLQRGD